MKKILAIIIVLCTFVCCLASCNKNEDTVIYEKNTWFTAEALELYMLEDLPEISEVEYIRGSKTVFAKMSDEQFDSYANEVFEYLKGQEFKYLGTRGEYVNNLIANYCYNFKSVDVLEDCIVNKYTPFEFEYELTYIFVYSDGTVDKDGNVVYNVVRIDKEQEDVTVKNGDEDFKCNVEITFYHGREGNVAYKF